MDRHGSMTPNTSSPNHHVIADLTEPIHVQLPGCSPQPAVIIGHDALTDLAVLRIDPKPLPRCVFRRPG